MATSGSKSVSVGSHYTLKFTWTLLSQSVEDNTSSVSWKMQLISDSSGRIDSTKAKEWSVTVNGTKYSGTNHIALGNSETRTLASGVTVIEHTADGSKTFSYSFKQEIAITFDSGYVGTKSGSGSGTLDTIIRLTKIDADDGTLGVAQVLTVTKYSSKLDFTIKYTCGDASGTIIEKSSSDAVSFTPALELARQNTTGMNVPVVFTVETINGDTIIGTTTKAITCAIPDSVKPSVKINVSDAVGYYGSAFDCYIQGNSKFHIVASADQVYGADIVAYKITADGKSYQNSTVTTDVIAGHGSMAIIAEATDSRGRIGKTTVTVEVAQYAVPKITALAVKRSDKSGSSMSNGEYLAVRFSAEVTSIDNQNTATYSLQYKRTSDAEYTTVRITAYANQYTVNDGLFVFAAEQYSSYDVILTVSDACNSTPRGATGASVSKLFSILRRGLGFAFGKVAEVENVFDVAFRTRHLGGFLYPELTTELDLNTLTTPNRYVLKGSNTYLNSPMGKTDAILDVIGVAEELLVQRFTTLSKTTRRIYERVYDSEGWGTWENTLENTLKNTLLAAYPVGKLYISTDSTSPADLFGGTWERIEDTFLLAAGSTYAAGSTGGEATHTLTISEMPSHNHNLRIQGTETAANALTYSSQKNRFGAGGTIVQNTGGGQPHNNMPPYLTVYVWKRTA